MINTITLDTYKQQIGSGDGFNLSDSFNGRVGDEQVPLVVNFKERGLAQQFQDGLVPFLTGFVGSLDENDQVTAETGEAVSYVGTSDDIVGLGRVKMNLPGTMFPQEGYFYGFLGLQNADGKRVTTFNVWFHVYNGNPDMFVNKAPFRTELQKLLDSAQQAVTATNSKYKSEFQTEFDKIASLSSDASNHLAEMISQLDVLQSKIKSSDIATNTQLEQALAKLNANLMTQLGKRPTNTEVVNMIKRGFTNFDGGQPHAIASSDVLKTTYPSGHDGVFITIDTGHKWMWGPDGTWVDGGAYQSTEIKDGTVSVQKLSPSARYGYIASGAPAVIDSVAKTLTLSNVWAIIAGTEVISTKDSIPGDVLIKLVTDNPDETGFWITYSKNSKQFEVYGSSDIPADNVGLGWVSIAGSVTYSLNVASVTVDGVNQTFPQIQHDIYLASGKPFKLDLKAKTLEIPDDYKNLFDGQDMTRIPNSGTINLDTGGTVSFIFYDSLNMEFAVVDSVTKASKAYFYLGYISWDLIPNINLKLWYTIDGYSTQVTAFNRNGYFAMGAPFILDIDSKTLTVPQNTYVHFITQYGMKDIRSANPDPIDLSNSTSASFLYINQTTLKITSSSSAGEQANDELYIGWISWTGVTPSYNFDFPIVFAKTNLGKIDYGMEDGVAFGDSITWSYNPTKWCDIVKSRLRLATMANAGVSGSTFTKDDSRTDSAVERVAGIKGDLITVWFGINDFHYGRKLGIFGDDDQSTVFGATDYVFKTLITNNPTSKIIVLTPMKQHGYNQSPDSFTKNKQGLLQSDYVNAIKRVADYYSLPILDLYAESGISPFIPGQATAYLRDGLHPNQAGEYRVANKIVDFINAH
ncbi:SGNH/GDSL hydrolase family protein [Lactiplantibacillus plantarum]|uniref:SGNH/GDSL hydrolase family protein n=1 Tax=Lactiplantibacillus plantarum TaxID=1590 RepID=UPI00189C09E1|nr:SGNH/GDSL hydrolase family protein [Lactiplantibacillus plantarum]MDB7775339.1 SGNH/GDSL hydrolase family protein [Lactiplantibacillus plantarum]DAF82807.1 MAG TPA: GDSL like Lipase Acylhydrolase [Caudoviricetes sp.]